MEETFIKVEMTPTKQNETARQPKWTITTIQDNIFFRELYLDRYHRNLLPFSLYTENGTMRLRIVGTHLHKL